MQSAIAHSRDVLLDRPIMHFHLHVRHRLLIGAKKRGHDSAGRQRPIADVQLGLAFACDRAHLSHRVVGVLQNRARFLEKSAAGIG